MEEYIKKKLEERNDRIIIAIIFLKNRISSKCSGKFSTNAEDRSG
jgi:hypothetical protein